MKFPKKHRLTSLDFQDVFASKTRHVRGSLIWITVLPSRTETKWGLVVSKKFDTRAVVRNRVKRIMREAVRHVVWPDGKHVVIGIASPKIAAANSEQVRDELNHLLRRV